jgi:hypothetical protein
MLVVSARRTDISMATTIYITPYYTGITASPQSTTIWAADGASVTSAKYSSQDAQFSGQFPGAMAMPHVFGSSIWHCLNYANTSNFKTTICNTETDTVMSGQSRLTASLTRGTGGITIVNCSTFSASLYFGVGSTFTLYGIRSVNQ